jgi:hypothetical protein
VSVKRDLSLIRGGNSTSFNSPDWLAGNKHIDPVIDLLSKTNNISSFQPEFTQSTNIFSLNPGSMVKRLHYKHIKITL